MRAFNAPFEVYGDIAKLFPGMADQVAQAFIDALISAKCITLFSFLFGLGFAVQMSRAEERGRLVSFYPRRLGILLDIGLIHAWLRKRALKTIAIWAIALTVLPLVIVARRRLLRRPV